MSNDEKREQGRALARKLFEGAAAAGQGGALPEALSDYTMTHLFGDVWQGDELALEERELITCTMLVALGREPELHLHFVAARNVGIPRTRIEGMITHAAHYAGWPVAVSASRVLNEVWPAE
jgi:4-carboxymuconolactone decarboxylase